MKKWISVATSLMLIAPSTFAKGSVEATQLQIVAMDASVDCNRTFFQSSSHFKGTIFAMPRVIQGAGPDSKRSIEIMPTADGKYMMYVRLFFPTNDSYLKTGSTSSASIDRDACNFDEVKSALNQGADPAKQITTVARMPLTSLEVTIPGITEVARIGREDETKEADILDYVGKSLTFVYNITEEEKNYIESQVVTLDGIPAQIKFRFQARSRNGSVHVNINSSALKANFLAQAKGQVYMADADVAVALRAAMDSTAISITSEAGTTDSSETTITTVINKILDEVSLASQTGKPKKAKETKKDDEEADSDSDEDTDKDKDKEDASAEEDDGESTKIADLSNSTGRIAVKAVAEIISRIEKKSFNFDQVGAPESATAQSEMRLRANRIQDSNIMEVAVQAAYQDPTAGVNIKAGQTISISPAYTFMDNIEYKARKTFVTTGMIQELDLAQYFEEITSPSMSIENKNINGTWMAQGKWTPFGGYSPVASPGSYRWVQVERIPVRSRETSETYKPTIEVLKQIPVAISFTGLGDRYQLQLAKLIGENDWWVARFDASSGRLLIKAKRDLGRITFRESMHGPKNIVVAPVVSNEIVMESQSMMGKVTPYKSVVFAEDKAAIVKQRTIVLYMSRPLSEQATENLDNQTANPKEVLPKKSSFAPRNTWWKIDPK